MAENHPGSPYSDSARWAERWPVLRFVTASRPWFGIGEPMPPTVWRNRELKLPLL